jgi:hypothetical protein
LVWQFLQIGQGNRLDEMVVETGDLSALAGVKVGSYFNGLQPVFGSAHVVTESFHEVREHFGSVGIVVHD